MARSKSSLRRFRIVVQLPYPDETSIITRPCELCHATSGQKCKSNDGAARDFHTVRVADAMGYGDIGRGVFVWKTGPFAGDIR